MFWPISTPQKFRLKGAGVHTIWHCVLNHTGPIVPNLVSNCMYPHYKVFQSSFQSYLVIIGYFLWPYTLLLLPIGDPQYQTMLYIQAKIHNRSRINVLHNHILAPGDIGLHLLQDYHPHSLLQRELSPIKILPVPFMFPQDPLRHPIVEPPKYPHNAWGNDPSNCSEDQDGLKNCGVEATGHLGIRYLLPQDTQQSVPELTHLLEVDNDLWTVILRIREEVLQVFEWCQFFQCTTICL